MTPLSAFRSRIAPRVLTALDLTIDQAVIDTAIDFCEQTLIIKATLDQFPTAAGVREYDIEATSGSENVCSLQRVWCESRELQALPEDAADSPLAYADAAGATAALKSTPRFFVEPSPGRISLYPTPDAVYQLTLRAAMKPKRSATEVQDVLYENWVDAIVDGSLFRLYSTPGMKFSNAALATAHAGLYKQGVNRALIEATRGRTRAEQYVRPMPI